MYNPSFVQSIHDYLVQYEWLKDKINWFSPDKLTLALAIVIAEITDPLRIPITIFVTRRIVKNARAAQQIVQKTAGLKPPPTVTVAKTSIKTKTPPS